MIRSTVAALTLALAATAWAGVPGSVDHPAPDVVRVRSGGVTVAVGTGLAADSPAPGWLALGIAVSAGPGSEVRLDRGAFVLHTPDRRLVPLAGWEQFVEEGRPLRHQLAAGDAIRSALAAVPEGRRGCRLELYASPGRRGPRDEVTVPPGTTCSGWLLFDLPEKAAPGRYVLTVNGEGLEAKLPFELPVAP